MNANAWVALVSALVSILTLIANFVLSIRTRAVAIGSLETTLRSAISQTRRSVRELAVQIGAMLDGKRQDELKAAEKRRLEPLLQAFNEAIEDNLNAYEDACAKYLDGKIDRQRFKKMYIEEIRNICTNMEAPTAKSMHPAQTSHLRAIWKVYREWHVHE